MKTKRDFGSHLLMPAWFTDLLGVRQIEEGMEFSLGGQQFILRSGIPRLKALLSTTQKQTEETFSFKWKKRETFERPERLMWMREWLVERYGDIGHAAWLDEHGDMPLVVDAGCGAGASALELLGPVLPRVRYLGIDISDAVDVAATRFSERGVSAAFLQADVANLPLPERSVDIIFSEGVIHHTDSTETTLKSLARRLKPGGRFLFYVYRRKGPIREFTDDYIRDRLQGLTPEEAWRALEPLTELGIKLGELDAVIDIPKDIDLLQIPAGPINVQRFFYWHVAKAFYRPDFTFDEMQHVNYDWYAPRNAHRQSPEEVRAWCAESGLIVEREVIEDAGITIIARKS
jgi:SAM-dependent methyltransferase